MADDLRPLERVRRGKQSVNAGAEILGVEGSGPWRRCRMRRRRREDGRASVGLMRGARARWGII